MEVERKKSRYCRSEAEEKNFLTVAQMCRSAAEARKMFRMAVVAGKNSLAVVENFLTARE